MELTNIKSAREDEGFNIELNESLFFRNVKIGFYEDMLNRIRELNEVIEIELKNLQN